MLQVRFARKLIVVLLGQSTGKTFQAIFQPNDAIGQQALQVFKAAQADAARAERAAAAVGANAGNSTRNAHRAETAAARAQKALSTARDAADLAAQQAVNAVVLSVKRAQRIRSSLFHNDLDATAVFGEPSPPLISPRTKNSSPQRSSSPPRSATRSSMRSAHAGGGSTLGGGSFAPPQFEPPPAPLFREGSLAAELAAKHAPPPPTPPLPSSPRSPSPSLDPYPSYPSDSDTELGHRPSPSGRSNQPPAHDGAPSPSGRSNQPPAHDGAPSPNGRSNQPPAHDGAPSPNGRSNQPPAHDGAPTPRPPRRARAPAVVGADFVRLEDGSIALVDLVRDDRGPVLAPLKPKPYTGGLSRQGSRGALTYAGTHGDHACTCSPRRLVPLPTGTHGDRSAGTAAGTPILGSPDKPLPPVRHPSQSLGATPRQQASHIRQQASHIRQQASHATARPATSWVPTPAPLAGLHATARPATSWVPKPASLASLPPRDATASAATGPSHPASHPTSHQGAPMGRYAWENQGLRALPSSMYERVVTASREGMATPQARSAASTPYHAKPYELDRSRYDLEAGLEVEWPTTSMPSVPSAQPHSANRAATGRSVRPTATSSAVSSAGLQLDPEIFASYTGPQHETRPPTTADGKPLGTPQPQLAAPRWARASVAQRMEKASADGRLPALLSPADHRTWSFEQGDFEKAERRFERQDRRERRLQRRAARQAAAERRDGRTAEGRHSNPQPTHLHGDAEMWTGAGQMQPDADAARCSQMQPPPSPSYRPRTTPIDEEPEGSRYFDGDDEGDEGGDRTTDEEAIDEEERFLIRDERFLIREERFLVDQYGPRMHPVPLSSVSPRPPGHGHSPPNTAPMHAHSPRRRRNAGRAAAPPAGGMLSQQAQGQAQPRGRTPASFASYDEAAMWLGARPRVLTAPA